MAHTAKRRRRPTLVEWLVLAAIGVIFVALLMPASKPPPPQTDADLDFSAWDDSVESSLQPPPELATSDVDLAGQWLSRNSHLWLEFEPADGNTWRVEFHSTSGCGLGPRIELERRATVEQGVITLDRPVQMLSGEMFRRLYVVRVDGRELLVPSAKLKRFAVTLQNSAPKERAERIEWEVLCRFEPANGS